MAATHRVNLPVAKGVTVETSPDGKQTALLFKTSTGPGFVGIALNNAELARMVSLLLSQAAKVAARVVPVSPPTKMTSRFRQRPIRLRRDCRVSSRPPGPDLCGRCVNATWTMHVSTTGKTARRKPS